MTEQQDDTGAAPDSSTQGVDPGVKPDDESGTITKKEQSAVGPGAGDNPVVTTTAPVQREGEDDVTRHPTLRDEGGGR